MALPRNSDFWWSAISPMNSTCFDRAISAREREARGLPCVASLSKDEFMEATTDVWELPSERATVVPQYEQTAATDDEVMSRTGAPHDGHLASSMPP